MNKVENFVQGLQDFINLNNDRASIIFAFSMVEAMVDDLIVLKTKHHRSYQNLSVATKINILHELSSLTDNQYEALNWFRRQRNKAAHRPGFSPAIGEIQDRWIMPGMDEDFPLRNFLITTVGTLWNKNPEIHK